MTVSRFAPAPTGYLHLGHVLNAIYVWGMTRSRHGRVLLRIEDHDRQRSRAEFERAILDDLAWLGFVPDGPAHRSAPTTGGVETDGADRRARPITTTADVGTDLRVRPIISTPASPDAGPLRQSDRGAVYDEALAGLRDAGLVYACDCTRAAIAQSPRSGSDGSELQYPGTCAEKRLVEAPGLGLRVRLAPSVESFVDLRHGAQTQRPADQCGDLLAKDREGNWTYQFAAAVDDYAQGVTLVIRGDDLLASTGRQIQLARLLGRREPPQFLHHPLLMKNSTQKISKSDGDAGVRDLRARGWLARDVIGHAAFLGGLIPAPRPIDASNLSSIIAA